MRRVTQLVLVAAFGVLVALVSVRPAAMAQPQVRSAAAVQVTPTVPTPAVPTPTVAAPSGPSLTPAPTVESARKTKQKWVIGCLAVLLLVIVYFGRRARAKRRKKVAGGTSG